MPMDSPLLVNELWLLVLAVLFVFMRKYQLVPFQLLLINRAEQSDWEASLVITDCNRNDTGKYTMTL